MNYNFQLFFNSPEGMKSLDKWSINNLDDYERLNLIVNQCGEYLRGTYFRGYENEMRSQFSSDMNKTYSERYDSVCQKYLEQYSGNERELIMQIPNMSLVLYCIFQDSHFYPILFNEQFFLFEDACKALGIEVPPIPSQAKKVERIKFYNLLCGNIEDFRKENNLTKVQVCSLLYDYAPKYLKSIALEKSILPEPENIWVVGGATGGEGDYLVMEENDTVIWQCNKDTKRGDIVIMYAHAPYMHIHSVWRCERDATLNPFGIYANRVELSNKVIIPNKVTYEDMQKDAVVSQFKMVVGNMQALYQKRPLSVIQYKEIQRLIQEKNPVFNLNRLPQITTPEMNIEETKKESEVSDKILIPCLTLLGYANQNGEDWVKELQLKLGRDRNDDEEKDEKGYKARPDFSFFVKKLPFEQQYAPLIIEVKYDMVNAEEERKAVAQGASYARILHSQIFGVCDKNKIVIYKRTGAHFKEKDKILDYTWAQVQDKDNPQYFNDLRKAIGKDVIERLK